MANEKALKALFKVTANNTNMVRYITGMSDFTDRTVIARIKTQLRSTMGSSIGNAAHYRINPLWQEHRRLFLSADKYMVEKTMTFAEVDESNSNRQHFVAELNRTALRAAARNLMVA